MEDLDPIEIALLVTQALEALGVPYVIGGSVASIVHGVPRNTNDVDLVADLRVEHVEPFVRTLGDAFYADAEMIREALQRRTSFNVIHWDTQFKVDVFIPKPRTFDQAQLARRSAEIVATEPERTAYVASAEDTILAKLECMGPFPLLRVTTFDKLPFCPLASLAVWWHNVIQAGGWPAPAGRRTGRHNGLAPRDGAS